MSEQAGMALECNHCGGDAIFSEDNLFFDGEGERCAECGFPGQVSIGDNGDEESNTADWSINDYDDEAKCNRADCEECHPKPEASR